MDIVLKCSMNCNHVASPFAAEQPWRAERNCEGIPSPQSLVPKDSRKKKQERSSLGFFAHLRWKGWWQPVVTVWQETPSRTCSCKPFWSNHICGYTMLHIQIIPNLYNLQILTSFSSGTLWNLQTWDAAAVVFLPRITTTAEIFALRFVDVHSMSCCSSGRRRHGCVQHTKWKLFVLAEVPQAGQIRRRNLEENLVFDHPNMGDSWGKFRLRTTLDQVVRKPHLLLLLAGVVGCEGAVVPQITLYKYI